MLPDAFGRPPLTESPRARPAGEGLRTAELLVPLRILRPLESDDEAVGLSLEGMSEGAKDSLSFRRAGSSRLGRDRSSSGRGMAGLGRFCVRWSSSALDARFLLSGDTGRGGREAGGFGGSLAGSVQ